MKSEQSQADIKLYIENRIVLFFPRNLWIYGDANIHAYIDQQVYREPVGK